MNMKRRCQNCNKEFVALKWNVIRGYGKYCTRSCRNVGAKLGFKEGHGSFWTEESREKFHKSHSSEKHHQWKGIDAGKIAKHAYIEGIKGRPMKCEHCGTEEKRTYDWANVDHEYSRNPDDYIRLCRPCHRKYDYARNKKTMVLS